MKFLAFCAVWVTTAAYASQSKVDPSVSQAISIDSISVKTPLRLSDQNDKATLLDLQGELLLPSEQTAQLNSAQLANRKVTHLSFSENSVILLTQGASDDPASVRQVEFSIPDNIGIDSFGNPSGLNGITATEGESNQGVSLAIRLTRPDIWKPYSHQGNQDCSFVEYRTICPDLPEVPVLKEAQSPATSSAACQTIAVTTQGTQTFDIEGESKSDGYTLTLSNGSSEQNTVIEFSLNSDRSTETFGACLIPK